MKRIKKMFVSRCKIWKLKEEKFRDEYRQRVQNRTRRIRHGGVEALWVD